jgi:hypothetical protein
MLKPLRFNNASHEVTLLVCKTQSAPLSLSIASHLDNWDKFDRVSSEYCDLKVIYRAKLFEKKQSSLSNRSFGFQYKLINELKKLALSCFSASFQTASPGKSPSNHNIHYLSSFINLYWKPNDRLDKEHRDNLPTNCCTRHNVF